MLAASPSRVVYEMGHLQIAHGTRRLPSELGCQRQRYPELLVLSSSDPTAPTKSHTDEIVGGSQGPHLLQGNWLMFGEPLAVDLVETSRVPRTWRTRLLDVLLPPRTIGMAAAGVTTRRAATSIATRRLPAWTSVGLEGRHCTRRRGDRR